MSKINQIQAAILSLDPGAYQKLMDSYVMKKYGFSNIMPFGSHSGTNKVTKGTPDSFVQCADGRFILIAHGSVGNHAYNKVEADILSCLDTAKTGIPIEDISQIICCHTSTNFTPGQVKKLCSYFENTILIGLGEVSFDLYLKYPDLAKDHLNIDIDTHQIFSLESFLTYFSCNPYSTSLDMPLLCREQELEYINHVLNESDVILLSGPAGVGKTRLALESAKTFAESNNYDLKIIRSNGKTIYQDLVAAFPDESNYMVVVDDADQLTELRYLLELSANTQRYHAVKIIITVGDYAREKLLKAIRTVLIPNQYEVHALSDDSVTKVLSDNLGIQNDRVLEQIKIIAKGNIRLAIMAGMCALNGKFGSIQNAFDIFNDYYGDIIGEFDRNEILVAAIIAFFDKFNLKETELPFNIALQHGISTVQFRDMCLSLHRKEVVSIFDDKAVKFENQNLRDYLLYYAFFKEKCLSPCDLICQAFPSYKNRVVFAFNTLVRLFNSPDNIAFIEEEIRAAWPKVKELPAATAFEFVATFYNAIPDEALLYLKKRIDTLPEAHVDMLKYDFEKHKNYHTIRSEIIGILIGFKYTDYFIDAIQLALYCFERNNSEPMDIYFLFGERWGIGLNSHKYGYAEELVLLKQLQEYHKANNSILSAYCLIFAAGYSLRTQYSATEWNYDKSTIYQLGLAACDEVFELRSLALESLFSVISDSPVQKNAVKMILEYPVYSASEFDEQVIAHDVSILDAIFPRPIDTTDFSICEILHHFEDVCIAQGIDWPASLPKSNQNSTYRLYTTLSKECLRKGDKIENVELRRVDAIEQMAVNASLQELDCLWEMLRSEVPESSSRDRWIIGNGIGILFSKLAQYDASKFVNCCKAYIDHQTPYSDERYSIINGLIKVLGYARAVEFVNCSTFGEKNHWLAILYDFVPDEYIDNCLIEKILECLRGRGDREHYTVSLKTVLRINGKFPGYLKRYMMELNNLGEENPHLLSGFLFRVGHGECIGTKELVEYFRGDIKVLCTAYIYAHQGRSYYDFDGELFSELIRGNPEFLAGYVHKVAGKQIGRDGWHALNILWQQDDYLKLISIAMECLKNATKPFFTWDSLAEDLLSSPINMPVVNKRRNEWIKYYVEANCYDGESMRFLFGIVCNLPEEQRLPAIVTFCQCNPAFEAFRSIYIIPTHASWSGSEVPILEQHIAFLSEIKDSLIGMQFVEHRAHISEKIRNLQERKEDVLLREFLEER